MLELQRSKHEKEKQKMLTYQGASYQSSMQALKDNEMILANDDLW
jgi:hypothetical protein